MDAPEVLARLQSRAAFLRGWIAHRLPRSIAPVVAPEDVMQDVWLAAFRSPDVGTLRTRADWDRWLIGVARKQIQQIERTAGRHKRPPASAKSERLLARMVDPQASGSHGPPREAARHEALDAVRIAIASLPDDCRIVMQLRYLKGRTQAQIARQTRMSVKDVRNGLERGLRAVRSLLGDLDKWRNGEQREG